MGDLKIPVTVLSCCQESASLLRDFNMKATLFAAGPSYVAVHGLPAIMPYADVTILLRHGIPFFSCS